MGIIVCLEKITDIVGKFDMSNKLVISKGSMLNLFQYIINVSRLDRFPISGDRDVRKLSDKFK